MTLPCPFQKAFDTEERVHFLALSKFLRAFPHLVNGKEQVLENVQRIQESCQIQSNLLLQPDKVVQRLFFSS